MRTQRAALAAAFAFALAALAADRAQGQLISRDGPAAGWSSMAPAATIDPGPTFPYSYYVALPGPARQYVPYGPLDQFPFHGTPYGRPYDPWSWATLAGLNAPHRYFYPPVR